MLNFVVAMLRLNSVNHNSVKWKIVELEGNKSWNEKYSENTEKFGVIKKIKKIIYFLKENVIHI